jgi:hypothetical protein
VLLLPKTKGKLHWQKRLLVLMVMTGVGQYMILL